MSCIGDPDRFEWVAFDGAGKTIGFHSQSVDLPAEGRRKARTFTYTMADVAKEFPDAHRIELMVGPELKAIFDEWCKPAARPTPLT